MSSAGDDCGIYVIRRSGGYECYVGQSVCIRKRWDKHRRDLRLGQHASKWMQNVFNKRGANELQFIVVQTGFDRSNKAALASAEQAWFTILRPVWNTLPVGIVRSGHKLPPETRAKMSISALGNKNRLGHSPSTKGTKRSAETIAKISAAKTGKPAPWKRVPKSEEEKRKVSIAKTGVPWSEKRRRAMRSRRGIPWTESRRSAHLKSKRRESK